MNRDSLGYLAIEGPIGVGKTSLARRLADAFGSKVLLERPEENPFLDRFYQARARFALPTQLFFLFQRARQIQQLKQGDMFRPGCVADFLLDKDSLFARVNLDDDELRLYEQVYSHLSLDLPVPDQVVYLQAPVDVLMARIRQRDLGYERLIEREYLQQVVDAYTQFFYHYSAGPILVVNAAEINFVDNDDDFEVLVDQIRKQHSGRHFFNPLSVGR
ncbi:MAG: deoxynucleoside kinase [Proteobacteria bacterium]|nr:MAG: deoxynucleoside kinase [Pseudomonadota bacterium]TDJ69728.1 MAG: deoxynucleoside kinase [Pseudomonadota bacterium]